LRIDLLSKEPGAVIHIYDMGTYFRPAIISMAELKFPVFQQVRATRRRQDSTACRSSTVAPLVIAWVTHELT